MYKELRPEQIDILVGSPAVNDEFSKKIRELARRLQANGMSYRDWDILMICFLTATAPPA